MREVVIVWQQASQATRVAAVRVRPDGLCDTLFVSDKTDDRISPYDPLPTYHGTMWRCYVTTWAPGDRLLILEEQREGGRIRWSVEHGPYAVAWRVVLPLVGR